MSCGPRAKLFPSGLSFLSFNVSSLDNISNFGWTGGDGFWSATTSSVVCLLIASQEVTPRVSARFGIIVVNLLWWFALLFALYL